MPVTYDPHPHPLRIARQKQGLSARQLGLQSGVNSNIILFIETRRRRHIYLHQLWALGKALRVREWWKLAEMGNLGPGAVQDAEEHPSRKRAAHADDRG